LLHCAESTEKLLKIAEVANFFLPQDIFVKNCKKYCGRFSLMHFIGLTFFLLASSGFGPPIFVREEDELARAWVDICPTLQACCVGEALSVAWNQYVS
jgi:hypothetical protein